MQFPGRISSQRCSRRIEQGLRRHARAGGGRHRQSGREAAWSAITGCAIRRSRQRRAARRYRGDERAHQEVRRRRARADRSHAERASDSNTSCSSESAAPRSGRSSSPTRSARRTTRWTSSFSTTPIRTASIACFDKIGDGLDAHARGRDLEIRRHEGDAQRNARGGSALSRKRGCDFAKHAVAVTGVGSELDKVAEKDGWLARFPMYDWVGGRTSVMSAVGLVPVALQGFDIDEFPRRRGGDGRAHPSAGRRCKTPPCCSR